MKNNKLSIGLFLIICVLLAVVYQQDRACQDLHAEINDLKVVNSTVATQNDSAFDALNIEHMKRLAQITQLQDELKTIEKLYDAQEIEYNGLIEIIEKYKEDDLTLLMYLEDDGISDLSIIENSLMNDSDVLELQGVLGGTMTIYKVEVLTDRWAFAYAEDGHISGYGLYEYTVNAVDDISWTRIIEMYQE